MKKEVRKVVWLFLESLRPFRWGIRYGNQWFVVRKAVVGIPMKTKQSKTPPQGYLVGRGIVSFHKNGTAIIR